MISKFGKYLLGNDLRAAIFALLFTLSTLILLPGGFIAGIIVGLVTLKKGYKSGLMILAFVALPAISLLALRQFGLFDVWLVRFVFIWLFALIFRKTHSWSSILELSVLFGIVLVIMIHFIIPDVKQTWLTTVGQALKVFNWGDATEEVKITVSNMLQFLAPVLTGMLIMLLFIGTLIQLILARWWSYLIVGMKIFPKEFTEIRSSYFAAAAIILATVGLYWKFAWLIDLYPVLIIPFIFSGLSLLHYLVHYQNKWKWFLIFIYLCLLVLPYFWAKLIIYTLGFLVLIGLTDSIVNIRKYLLIPKV